MTRPIFFIFVVSFFVKLLIALWVPVSLDESYYFLWGQFPSLSYFDHPPMTGWMMMLSQPLKSVHEGAIRWPFIAMSHVTLFIWLSIAQSMMSQQRIYFFLLVGLLNPLWGMGSIFATPDIPLLFFWSLSLYFCEKSIRTESLFAFLGLALTLGLAFLSKYQVVLFLPCLVIVLLQQHKLRLLLKPKTWVAIFVALIVCTPVLYWNYSHDWVSFNFQWNHGMSGRSWKWSYPIEFFFTQFGLIFPVFFIFIFGRNGRWFSHWLSPFAFFPFFFFFYSSFKGRVEGNWVIMAFPAFYALSLAFVDSAHFRWITKTLQLWAFLLVLALSLPLVRDEFDIKEIKIFEPDKFRPILDSLDDSKNYLTDSYQLSGYLSFKKDRLFCKLPKYGRMDHMDFIQKCRNKPEHFFYITERDQNPPINIDFPGWEKVADIEINEKYKFIEIRKK